MTSPHRHRPTVTPDMRRLGAWWLGILLAALVWAPWVASVHGVLHGKPGRTAEAVLAASHAPVAMAAFVEHGSATDAHGLFRLFGGHTHDNDCRLFDQLSHADGLHFVTAVPLVLLPPVAVLAWHAGECLRRWATLFDARGPPSLA